MARRRTRAEAEIEAQLQNLDPGSVRFRVLSCARDFKASWIALAEQLTVVREQESFRQWGYANFEAYARRELHLRSDTANKLTRSFGYLRDHEPRAIEQRQARELPPLDVVDLLSRANERTKLSEKQLSSIHDEVFADDAEPPTRSQVMRRFREVDPDAFKGKPRAPSAKSEGSVDTRKALLLAERLLSLIEVHEGISSKAIAGVRTAAAELRDMMEAQQQKSA